MRYTRGANPLRDRDGNEVAGFGDQAVTNVTAAGLPERAGDRDDAHPALRRGPGQGLGARARPTSYVLVNGLWFMVVGPCDDVACDGGVAIDGAKVRLTLESRR